MGTLVTLLDRAATTVPPSDENLAEVAALLERLASEALQINVQVGAISRFGWFLQVILSSDCDV